MRKSAQVALEDQLPNARIADCPLETEAEPVGPPGCRGEAEHLRRGDCRMQRRHADRGVVLRLVDHEQVSTGRVFVEHRHRLEVDAESAGQILPARLRKQVAPHRRPDHPHPQLFLCPAGHEQPHHGFAAPRGALDDHRPCLGKLGLPVDMRAGKHLDHPSDHPALVVPGLDPHSFQQPVTERGIHERSVPGVGGMGG